MRQIRLEKLVVRKYLQLVAFGLMALGIPALTAYPNPQAKRVTAAVVSSATRDDRLYSTDMKVLRTRFNKDKGKVRLLMLLSPT